MDGGQDSDGLNPDAMDCRICLPRRASWLLHVRVHTSIMDVKIFMTGRDGNTILFLGKYVILKVRCYFKLFNCLENDCIALEEVFIS